MVVTGKVSHTAQQLLTGISPWDVQIRMMLPCDTVAEWRPVVGRHCARQERHRAAYSWPAVTRTTSSRHCRRNGPAAGSQRVRSQVLPLRQGGPGELVRRLPMEAASPQAPLPFWCVLTSPKPDCCAVQDRMPSKCLALAGCTCRSVRRDACRRSE